MSDKTADDIFKLAKDEHSSTSTSALRLPGTMQHFTIPIYVFDETVFEEGVPSTAHRLRGSNRFASPTCCCFPTRRPRPSTRFAPPEP